MIIDLILNAVKIATSEDVRKSATNLLNAIVRSPEWQKDICVLEAKINGLYKEQCVLIADITANKMSNLQYPENKIAAFQRSFNELTENAFEHGCKTKRDFIEVSLDISASYVALSVVNTRKKFDSLSIVEKNRQQLKQDPYKRRGRGLIFTAQSADSFEPINKNRGLKVVFYKSAADFQIYSLANKGLTIISIKKGVMTQAFKEKIISISKNYLHTNLILDFSDWSNTVATFSDEYWKTIGTRFIQTWSFRKHYTGSIHSSLESDLVLEVYRIFESSEKKIVALLPPYGLFNTDPHLPEIVVAYSWDEALRKISLLKSIIPSIRKRVKEIAEKNIHPPEKE